MYMQQTKQSRPDEVECENCNQTVLPGDYLFEAGYCTFCKGKDQSADPQEVAVEALLHAADTVERWVANERDHYENTDKTPSIGPRQTYRRAFNSAFDYNQDSNLTGDEFDRAEDIFSEPMTLALSHDIEGENAAEFYRNQAKAILEK